MFAYILMNDFICLVVSALQNLTNAMEKKHVYADVAHLHIYCYIHASYGISSEHW